MSNIAAIFAVGKRKRLYSLRYHDGNYESDSQHVLSQYIDRWQDATYLFDFYDEHKDDLYAGFFEKHDFQSFADQTYEEAERLKNKLYAAADHRDPRQLLRLFQPLDDRDHDRENFEQLKSKGDEKKSWLRLYALQTRDDKIYLVGGAIKLVKRMPDRVHLQSEADRLVVVRKELSKIIRDDTLYELII